MSGENFRKSGPIGKAPHSGSGAMSQSSPVTANTTARQNPANQSSTQDFCKEQKTFSAGPGELGARGNGGAC